MTVSSLIAILIIGAIAGWLAGLIMKGGGFGLLGNIVMGIVGAFVADLVLPAIGLGLGAGLLGNIVNATIGAVIVIFLIRLVKRV